MLRRWPARQGGYHASAECVGVLAWVVCPTGAAFAFGALVVEAGGVACLSNWRRHCVWCSCRRGRRSRRGNVYCTLAPRSWLVSFFMSGFCGGSASFFACWCMGGGGVDGQCVTYLNCTLTFPPSPPTLPCPLFGSVPCLRAKHSSYSRNPSRQGPSWLARHFCNNYPSALDLVLALALVALVLGVIYRGSIVLRLFNWSFDFWFACYWICQAD